MVQPCSGRSTLALQCQLQQQPLREVGVGRFYLQILLGFSSYFQDNHQ